MEAWEETDLRYRDPINHRVVVYCDVVTLFEFDSVACSSAGLEAILSHCATPKEKARHLTYIDDRRRGSVSLADLARKTRLDSVRLSQVEGSLEIPVYSSNISEDITVRWSIDLFNPGNNDCNVKGWRSEFEYLCLVIEARTFLPFSLLHETRGCNELKSRYDALFAFLKEAYSCARPTFMCGTSDNHLLQYCRLFGGGKRVKRAPALRDLFWEWAVYDNDEVDINTEALRELNNLPRSWHPCCGLYFDPWDDTRTLVWAMENHIGDNAYYSPVIGKQDIFQLTMQITGREA